MELMRPPSGVQGPRAYPRPVPDGASSLLRAALLGAAAALAAADARARDARFGVELALGGAASLGSTLRVEQGSHPALELDADWETRSLEAPLYYAVRVSRVGAGGGWAVRLVHHKLYLRNPPPEIERFSISHGYNLLTLERGFVVSGFTLWAGAGVVIAHPETTVRGLAQPESEGGIGGGYHVTGPAAAIAAARPLALTRRLAIVPELGFTLARARVPVADGEASAPNAAFHFAIGLQLGF
jgi:hypothetical protein